MRHQDSFDDSDKWKVGAVRRQILDATHAEPEERRRSNSDRPERRELHAAQRCVHAQDGLIDFCYFRATENIAPAHARIVLRNDLGRARLVERREGRLQDVAHGNALTRGVAWKPDVHCPLDGRDELDPLQESTPRSSSRFIEGSGVDRCVPLLESARARGGRVPAGTTRRQRRAERHQPEAARSCRSRRFRQPPATERSFSSASAAAAWADRIA